MCLCSRFVGVAVCVVFCLSRCFSFVRVGVCVCVSVAVCVVVF